MDASNLATLFAPNILHKPIKELSTNDLSEEMTMERRLAIDVITALIVNYEYLFKVWWNTYYYFLEFTQPYKKLNSILSIRIITIIMLV